MFSLLILVSFYTGLYLQSSMELTFVRIDYLRPD